MAVRIPTLQRRVAPEVAAAPRVAQASVDASGLARGLSNLANDFEQIHQREVEEANQTFAISTDSGATEWKNNRLYNPESGAMSQKGENAIGLTERVMADWGDYSKSVIENAKTPAQKMIASRIMSNQGSQIQGQLSPYELQEIKVYKDGVSAGGVITAQNDAALNYGVPGAIDQAQMKIEGILDLQGQRNGWSPELLGANKQKALSGMMTDVVQNALTKSTQAGQALFDRYKPIMDADSQARVGGWIDTSRRRDEAEARARLIEQRQLQAIARGELQSRVQDANAAALNGFVPGDVPTFSDFRRSFDNEDQARSAYSSFQKVQAIAPVAQELHSAPVDQWPQILQQFDKTHDGVAGPGFKEDLEIQQHVSRLADTIAKQRQSDPAAYAVQYSQPVRDAFVKAQQTGDPKDYQAYAEAAVAEQRRLGVQSPQLLPAATASQIAAKFNDQVAGGDSAATMIEQQEEQWGKSFPLIVKQLGNMLPPEAQVIATKLPKDTAERMASVAQLSEEDLKKGLDKGVADSVATAVHSKMENLANSLQGQSEGVRTYNTMYQAAYKTALSYARQGETADKAAERVVKGMVDDKYEFFEAYRVPRALNTAAIKRGAESAIDRMTGDDLSVLVGIPGVSEEENLRQWLDKVKSSGQWVTNGDETGLMLMQGGYQVRGKDGLPIVRTWNELTDAGLQQRHRARQRTKGLGVSE
ncbi:hypothetical protein [Pseudomonas sp. DG56-2]|uniref:hypothetical protein n=1 Tax=Pseudomonas sp. DG56-2 TaxID=2320270 RepID=UPI0010A66174|nr:hypothetical protein [Pseudomonas sp. DG56-2]